MPSLTHTHLCIRHCICMYTKMQIVPWVMFNTARAPPQQLTSLLMRGALSSSQMAPPGTLPCEHTLTHTPAWVVRTLASPATRPHAEQPLVVRARRCPSPGQRAALSLLPCIVTPSPPFVLPPIPLHHPWQLLIHVAALQMSQLTSWESSGGEIWGGGEEQAEEETEEERVSSTYQHEETHLLLKIHESSHKRWNRFQTGLNKFRPNLLRQLDFSLLVSLFLGLLFLFFLKDIYQISGGRWTQGKCGTRMHACVLMSMALGRGTARCGSPSACPWSSPPGPGY